MRRPEERRYAFETATIDRRLGRELPGLELLRRIRDGELPTAAMAQTLAFRFAEVEPGRVVVEGEAERFVYNMWGIAHGGWAATQKASTTREPLAAPRSSASRRLSAAARRRSAPKMDRLRTHAVQRSLRR